MAIDRAERLKAYLKEIARKKDAGMEAIAPASVEEVVARAQKSSDEVITEGVAAPSIDPTIEATVQAANAGLEKVKADADAADLSPEEMLGLEAIILPKERPAVDIVGGKYFVGHELWRDLNSGPIAARLARAIPSVGRIGLPGQQRIPYAGTGFVVGKGLIMTNRHVAEIFARGLGDRGIIFKSGWQADIDFLRERGRPERDVAQVRGIRMIHPFWDMALLEVEGLDAHPPLTLSLKDATALDGHRVAVIGYPAYDPERNDVAVQNQLFSNTYQVKRLQPGQLGRPLNTASFQKLVPAATHDCSTLGGNSGSAVIDLDNGEVLALHFGGRYLETNYCVPTFALSQDGRVVDALLNFAPTPVGGVPPWSSYWQGAFPGTEQASDNGGGGNGPPPLSGDRQAPPPPPPPATRGAGGEVSFTVPITITVTLGRPSSPTGAVESVAPAPSVDSEERLAEIWHDPAYDNRDGYQEDFIPGAVVPMPRAADPSVLAPVKGGGNTLDYGHFSIQMHAARRLALFTASNVTGEAKLRRPEPGRDYSRRGLSGLGPNDMEKWFADPRLDARYQLSDRFYTKDDGAFDKGHIVRRDDVAWGSSYDLLRQANGDTYHITNCSPQVAQFNQSQRGVDNWGDLENLVLGQAASERYCLFAGPILDPTDDIFVGKDASGNTPLRLRVPRAFWKVVVAKVEEGIAAYAFVLDQDLSGVDLEFTVPDAFRRRMVSIAELERRAGVVFDDIVRDNDQFDDDRGIEVAFRAGIERVAALDASAPEEPSPNGGDDAEAAEEAGSGVADTEAPLAYRLARALEALRAEVNAKAPGRKKGWDGWIGDAAHQSRASDHNPWVRDGATGVVTAIDVTHDPAGGCDAGKLAEKLRALADKRIKYIIWSKRIANREPIGGAAAWAWRPYGGKNPHDHHVHISVRPEKVYYDAAGPWVV